MTAHKNKTKTTQMTQNHSDFSIDHILNKAGSSSSSVNTSSQNLPTSSDFTLDHYSWLHCTRYCPPKVSRNQKRCGPQKRQLGRHPRIPFTSQQLSVLEEKFHQSPYLSSEEVIVLANQLQLADIRVKIWFQNRRARERRERGQNLSRQNVETNLKESNEKAQNPEIHIFSPQSALKEYLNPFPQQINLVNKSNV